MHKSQREFESRVIHECAQMNHAAWEPLLQLNVPDHWWNNLVTSDLNASKTTQFDAEEEKWDLVCEDDPEHSHKMNCKATPECVDEQHKTHSDFEELLTERVVREVDEADDNTIVFHSKTDQSEWQKVDVTVDNPSGGRAVQPIPWTGNEDEQFTPEVTAEERAMFKDRHGQIKHNKIFCWCLPQFGDNEESIFQWQAARMNDHMIETMRDPQIQFEPRSHKPLEGEFTLPSHVAVSHGAAVARMFSGNRSFKDCFSTRDLFAAVEPTKDAITCDQVRDLSRCLRFADNWDHTICPDAREEPRHGTPFHRRKFSVLEDAHCGRWQDLVDFGKWITADESRIAGWCESSTTIGPEPKPVRTGATLHTLCISKGSLQSCELCAWTHGGKSDAELRDPACESKMNICLCSKMLHRREGNGHCVCMDSACVSDGMALMGRKEWKINMVGACQTNGTGAGELAKPNVKVLPTDAHKSLFCQHKTEPLSHAVWSDNNIAKTLSDFHSPVIELGGILRKQKDDDGG